MKCPVCKTVDLTMTDRQGIEIDYCPQCRGVWLDRGELDKLIERAMSGSYLKDHDDDDDRHYQDRDRYYQSGAYPHKRKSFLGDLFDFD
jgi:Zn-finger nucleic acid-binding protein